LIPVERSIHGEGAFGNWRFAAASRPPWIENPSMVQNVSLTPP
jgi:hypothetical protein